MHCAKPERDGVLQRPHAPVHGDYDVTDRVAVNAQASRGFRLGGVNDPLNDKPLCKDANYDTYRVSSEFKDETLWNYEVGLKSSYEKVTLNGSLFYADIE